MEKAILLHESRKGRIPVESDIEDDHVVISVQHLCRELNKDCLEEMQNWIMFTSGWDLYVLSQCILRFPVVEVPWYLHLLQYQFSLLLLLIWKVCEPLPFELFFRKNCFWLAWEKKENKWKLSNWLWYSPLCCWVTQCFQWFPKNICQKWRYNQQNAVHVFCKKGGFWWSVTRDIYSQFFKYVFRFKTSNLSACVPISLNDNKWIYFEKIITHCFIQCKTFPTSFLKAI